MLSAALDVGSNTIRLLIGDVHDHLLHRVHADRIITRLADGLPKSGRLSQERISASLSALTDFSQTMRGFGVSRVRAVGTSALREAMNSSILIDMVLRDTGIKIEVISGKREAELTSRGVLFAHEHGTEPVLIVDIGGGSTEWILPGTKRAQESILSASLPLGVVNLFERFIAADRPTSDDLSLLGNEIDRHLIPLKNALPMSICRNAALVGTGGTITTLAAMDLGLEQYDPDRVHMHSLSLEKIYSLRDMILSLPLEQRQSLAGLEQGRADLIIPGVLLTIKLMESFGFRSLTVSDYGLLEGLLMESDSEDSL